MSRIFQKICGSWILLTLGNLGRDGESLEERGLLRTQTGVVGGNDDGQGSNSTRTSWGTDFVLQQLVTDINKVSAGEHEANVSLDVGQQLLKSWVGVHMVLDGLAHHGVLSHKDNAVTTQRNTDLLHLGRAHIVCTHDETFWVLV